MSARHCLTALTWRCLANPEQCAAAPHPLISSFFIDRIARSFLGLLALSHFLPTATLYSCGGHRMAGGGGMDCLFEAGPRAFVENVLYRPIVEQRTSSPPRRRNFVRSAAERTRRERHRLRRRQ